MLFVLKSSSHDIIQKYIKKTFLKIYYLCKNHQVVISIIVAKW
jgi:hypothetical protein